MVFIVVIVWFVVLWVVIQCSHVVTYQHFRECVLVCSCPFPAFLIPFNISEPNKPKIIKNGLFIKSADDCEFLHLKKKL
jgi:hypothetical protein